MILEDIAKALGELKGPETLSLTDKAIEEGIAPTKIILNGLCAGMDKVGELYEKKQYFVPDMLSSSQIFNNAMSKIKPLIADQDSEPRAKGVIGLVKGNTQDNGKNIVQIMLEANGFKVEDLGKSVAKDKFLKAADEGVDFIGLSVMTSAGVKQAQLIAKELEIKGLRTGIKIIVGGAAVDADKSKEIIGADGYANDAGEAVSILKQWFPSKEN
ncbi:MAG: cobalamin-binding protein [Bacteroidetes bacterium]|nr:MAG: cobalamin-binding protein [Bacteroidota bacterium]